MVEEYMKAADKHQKLGDAPIEERQREPMNVLADVIDEALNGDKSGADREYGFMLLVFPFGDKPNEGHRANYISNARREDIIVLLKEQLARFEGQPDIRGRA